MELETPVMGHEQPEDLILNARRKIFNVNTNNDILSRAVSSPLQPQDRLAEGLPHAMSLTSVGETDFLNSADNSPTIEPANRNAPRRKVVSFAKTQAEESGTEDTLRTPLQLPRHSQLPALSPFVSSPKQERPSAPLIRARLVSKSSSKNTLVVSFPRVVCDFWSSCLFMQQLADVYGKLEKAVDYRPSLAARKMESQRQEVKGAYEREKKKNAPVRKLDAATRLLQKRNTAKKAEAVVACCLVPMVSPRLSFPQVAQREKQLVMMMSRDDLQGFWESAITATIRRERGLSRTKVVPPVRIPSGLGEKAPVSSYGRRPQTSRLRPLTASRARPATAKRQGGGGFGEAGFTRETLLGPTTKFHFIKVCFLFFYFINLFSAFLYATPPFCHAPPLIYLAPPTSHDRLKMKFVSSSSLCFPKAALSHPTNSFGSSP